jgi:hypothetical protein
MLSTLNISATQALFNRLQALEKENLELQKVLDTDQATALKRLEVLEKQLLPTVKK